MANQVRQYSMIRGVREAVVIRDQKDKFLREELKITLILDKTRLLILVNEYLFRISI